MHKLFLSITALLLPAAVWSQTTITSTEAVTQALKNNPSVQAAELAVREAQALRLTALETGKFSVMWLSGQYNSLRTDNNITLNQSLPLPTTMAAQSRLAREQVTGAARQLAVVRNELAYAVRDAFDALLFLRARLRVLQSQDSIYIETAAAAATRHRTGEGTLLEKMTTEAQSLEAGNQVRQQEADIRIQESQLRKLLYLDDGTVLTGAFKRLSLTETPDTASVRNNPVLNLMRQQAVIGFRQASVQRNQLMPDLNIGYFTQSLIGFQRIDNADVFFGREKKFTGFQLGLSVPLWAGPQVARARAATLNAQSMQKQADLAAHNLRHEYLQATQELDKAAATVRYYEDTAAPQATLLIDQSRKAYLQGELAYPALLQALRSALDIRTGQLNALLQYNRAINKILYLNGQHENN
ncbi:MAG: TolC family protein [Bacteroidota bacterium]